MKIALYSFGPARVWDIFWELLSRRDECDPRFSRVSPRHQEFKVDTVYRYNQIHRFTTAMSLLAKQQEEMRKGKGFEFSPSAKRTPDSPFYLRFLIIPNRVPFAIKDLNFGLKFA